MVDVRWTGAAGLEFTHNGRTILIDPYHSRPGKLKSLLGRLRPDVRAIESYLEKLPGRLSAIIVGHTHHDHALDIPEFSRHLDGPLIGSPSLDNLMVRHGLPGRVTAGEKGARIEIPDGAVVTMIPSTHGLVALGRVPFPGDIDPGGPLPMKTREYRLGAAYIPRLEVGGVTFMHAGSANLIEQELSGHECDVLFMCIPGWKKVPAYTTRLLEITKPRVVIPFHYDDFTTPIRPRVKPRTLPFIDISGFLQQIRRNAPGIEIRVLTPFETVTF